MRQLCHQHMGRPSALPSCSCQQRETSSPHFKKTPRKRNTAPQGGAGWAGSQNTASLFGMAAWGRDPVRPGREGCAGSCRLPAAPDNVEGSAASEGVARVFRTPPSAASGRRRAKACSPRLSSQPASDNAAFRGRFPSCANTHLRSGAGHRPCPLPACPPPLTTATRGTLTACVLDGWTGHGK